MDRTMFEDHEETLILLMRMETEGTLGNTLVSAFRKWYLFPPMSLLILNHYHCFTPYVQISHNHYYILGLFCDPNIIANNKERCFWNLAVANHNSSQILKLLRYHNIRTRTIASPSQLPNLIQSQNFSDYNCFYPLFAINTTSETICNKPITATI
jgi:hypothetical protein